MTKHYPRPLVLIAVTLLATAAAIFVVFSSPQNPAGASDGGDGNNQAQATPTPEPTQATPEPTQAPSDPEIEVEQSNEPPTSPLNSTIPVERTTTVVAPWGTISAKEVALEEGSTSLVLPRSASSRPRSASGFDDDWNHSGRHKGRAELEWDTDLFDSSDDTRTVSHHRIERQYFFPDDHGPSRFQLIRATHQHNSSASKQRLLDTDVASRSVYRYRITPVLSDGSELEPWLIRLKSDTSQRLEAFGVADGVQIEMRHTRSEDDSADGEEAWLYRLPRGTSGLYSSYHWNPSSKFREHTPVEDYMSYTDTGRHRERGYAYLHIIVQRNKDNTTTNLLYSPLVWTRTTHLPPSKPRDLVVLGASGSDISLEWDAPSTNSFQVAQYEILRRSLSPETEWVVIGTTKRTSFTDTKNESGAVYRYAVRTVTKQGTRGPATGESESVGPALDFACTVEGGAVKDVTRMVASFDAYSDSPVVNPYVVDVLAYVDTETTDDEGETTITTERCNRWDIDRVYLKKEVYYRHELNGNCENTELSCDILDVTPGQGTVESLIDEIMLRMPVGDETLQGQRFYINGRPFFQPGVIGLRYSSCVMQDDGESLCSEWVDSGKIPWLVDGPDFREEEITTDVINYPTLPPILEW